MCTATWMVTEDGGGYHFLFNRDESVLRQRASPPSATVHADGAESLAPTDTDAGGTWISVNTHGVTVALLNRYQDQVTAVEPPDGWISRGRLVRAMASATDPSEVAERLNAQSDLRRWRPFTLLALAIGDGAPTVLAFDWDGGQLKTAAETTPPRVSSGYDHEGAAIYRRALWEEKLREAPAGPNLELLRAFHRSHRPDHGAYSPCMRRPEARTVSLTEIEVRTDTVTMRYWDGPPCTTDRSSETTLRRPVAVVRPCAD
ncbi:MAG: NRDE family protein [Acidobacteriota bacterium]